MSFTVLAIDTATELASVALYDGEKGPRAESTWYTSMNHTVELMPTIVIMLDKQGLAAEELDGLAVALGPGSFTGLRIGLSVAKGLSLALGIPIVGIPTLDIVAYAHYGQDLPICAIIQAGRGRICVAFYERQGTNWQRLTDYQLATIEELSAQVKGPTLFCGEIDNSLNAALQAHMGARATIASPASSLRRASYLAELGWQRLRAGEEDDLTTLEPLYLHHPNIGD
jgi:tRNA threonylcarbamoyladenosine biosynthesis protein TsaB